MRFSFLSKVLWGGSSRNCQFYALFFSGILFLSFANNAAAFSLKDTAVDEIDISGTEYYGRLLVAEDFNNDGITEILYIRLSPEYMNYVWSSKGQAKRKDKSYNKQGMKLSKSPEWFASFLPSTMQKNKPVSGRWQAKFNSDVGCVHPSQIIPAHLNEDNFLDFVVPCHGYDAPPYPGEHSLVLLSNGLDSYKVTKLTKQPGFYHDGATADFNVDGKTDILLVDAKAKKLRILLNNGDGKFKSSGKYLPQFSSWKGAYTTEILDVNDDGYFDIFVAGHEDDKYGRQPTVILLGNKNNKFSSKQKITIPAVEGYGVVLDVIKVGKNLFVLRTGSGQKFYQGVVIQHVDIETLQTIKIQEKAEMKHVDRIFRKLDQAGRLKIGGLTSKENGIDFIFDGKEMMPIN